MSLVLNTITLLDDLGLGDSTLIFIYLNHSLSSFCFCFFSLKQTPQENTTINPQFRTLLTTYLLHKYSTYTARKIHQRTYTKLRNNNTLHKYIHRTQNTPENLHETQKQQHTSNNLKEVNMANPSGSGGFYKYRCKYFHSHNCPHWVYVNNAPCAYCLVSQPGLPLMSFHLGRAPRNLVYTNHVQALTNF